MAKIRYKVDAKGVLQASADMQLNGRLVKISVQGATVPDGDKNDVGVWAQVTMDLFSAKDSIRNGTSEQETV